MMPEHTQPMLPVQPAVKCFYCGVVIADASQRWTLHGANNQRIDVHGGCIVFLAKAFALDSADLTQITEKRFVLS